MISVDEIVTDDDLAQEFTVTRSIGDFVNGRWVEGTPTEIVMVGVISVMNAKELNQLPEGDRIKGAMVFHSTELIHTTSADNSGISDKIVWRGDTYKIFNVWNYLDYGYCKCAAERTEGD